MKRFLVINTSFFGDILLTGSLCQNIKLEYPDSKITFIANKPFYEAACFIKGADETVAYDKKGAHRGLKGAWRFYREYRNKFAAGFDAAFVIYGNERGVILAKLFGAEKIYADNSGIINWLTDNPRKINYCGETKVQHKNAMLLSQYTKQPVKKLAMKYTPDARAAKEAEVLLSGLQRAEDGGKKEQKFIALCTTSKKKEKDMPPDDCAVLLDRLKTLGYTPLLLGAGSVSREYAENLNKKGCCFVDLVDKTSIAQLGAVLAKCRALISVDTGTMHLGLSVGVPAVCLFYVHTKEHLAAWAPEKELYKCRVLADDLSADNILKALNELLS